MESFRTTPDTKAEKGEMAGPCPEASQHAQVSLQELAVRRKEDEQNRQTELAKVRGVLDRHEARQMIEVSPSPKTLHSEHLREDVPPVMVSVGTHPELQETVGMRDILKNGEHINFWSSTEKLNKRGIANAGDGTYVISKIDSRDKYTRGLRDCTTLIGAGIDKQTKESVSFLTHQRPDQFLGIHRDAFEHDLGEKLKELKARCEEGTLDVVILGGNYLSKQPQKVLGFLWKKKNSDRFQQNYIDSVASLTKQVETELGFEPVVAVGPKMMGGTSWGRVIEENVFYDTKERRTYLERLKEGENIPPSFQGGEVEEKSKEWPQ